MSPFVGALGVSGGEALRGVPFVGVVSEGLGARIIGTEVGRTLSASDPSCAGELLRLLNEGSGGCSTTQTCWVEGGDMTLGVTPEVTLCVTAGVTHEVGSGLLGLLLTLSAASEVQKRSLISLIFLLAKI